MSAFHEMVESDIVCEFLDPTIFGEEHMIDDVPIMCVLDADIHQTDQNGRSHGVYDRDLVMFAHECDLKRRAEGTPITIDGRIYTVVSWRVDMGVIEAALSRRKSYV